MIIYKKETRELIIPNGLGNLNGLSDDAMGAIVDAAEADGRVEGIEEGKEIGAAEQKSKMETLSVTENGVYEREDGYNRVEVNVEGGGEGGGCNLEDKWVNPSMNDRDGNGLIVVSPSEGYDGMFRTVINPQTIYNEGMEAAGGEVPEIKTTEVVLGPVFDMASRSAGDVVARPAITYNADDYHIWYVDLSVLNRFEIEMQFRWNGEESEDGDPQNLFGTELSDWGNSTFGARYYAGLFTLKIGELSIDFGANTDWNKLRMGFNREEGKVWMELFGEYHEMDIDGNSLSLSNLPIYFGASNTGENPFRLWRGSIGITNIKDDVSTINIAPNMEGNYFEYVNSLNRGTVGVLSKQMGGAYYELIEDGLYNGFSKATAYYALQEKNIMLRDDNFTDGDTIYVEKDEPYDGLSRLWIDVSQFRREVTDNSYLNRWYTYTSRISDLNDDMDYRVYNNVNNGGVFESVFYGNDIESVDNRAAIIRPYFQNGNHQENNVTGIGKLVFGNPDNMLIKGCGVVQFGGINCQKVETVDSEAFKYMTELIYLGAMDNLGESFTEGLTVDFSYCPKIYTGYKSEEDLQKFADGLYDFNTANVNGLGVNTSTIRFLNAVQERGENNDALVTIQNKGWNVEFI